MTDRRLRERHVRRGMTRGGVRTPATATLQITLILSLLVYQPVNLSPCNVGTVLFGPVDALACCLDNEKYFTLVFRRMLNNVVPVPLQNAKGDAYICAFISFVHGSARAAFVKTPPIIARSFISALFDVTGGYLRAYLLPVTREAFYAGNVRLVEVRKLYGLYDDIKGHLRTDGQSWSSPLGQYNILHKVRSLDIQFSSPEAAFSCENFLFNATARTMEGSRSTTEYSVMPIPYFDDNKNPSSVALPLRYGALRSIVSPESAYIILAHYVRSVRCLRYQGVSADTFVKYNRNFRRWLLKTVLPRLGDERWYPAFGGILRVLKKTGEYRRTKRSRKRYVRTSRQANTKFEMSGDSIFSYKKDSLVDAVADDFIPIDVAVLQKLMYPNIKKDASPEVGWEISILPETINPDMKNEMTYDHSKDFINIGNFVPTASSIVTSVDVTENTNRLELHGSMIIQNETAEFVLVPLETKQNMNSKATSDKTVTSASTVNMKREHSNFDESGNLEEDEEVSNFTSPNIIIGFESENLNFPMIKAKESAHPFFQVKKLTSSKMSQTSENKKNDNQKMIHKSETTQCTSSDSKKHITNVQKLVTTTESDNIVQKEHFLEKVKVNHGAGSIELPSFMSMKKEKLLREDTTKLTTKASVETMESSNEYTTNLDAIHSEVNEVSEVKPIMKSTTKSKLQKNKGTSHHNEIDHQSSPTSCSKELSSERIVSTGSESSHFIEKTTDEETQKPNPLLLKLKTSTLGESLSKSSKEYWNIQFQSTSTAPPFRMDSSIYSNLFGVGIGPHNFENLTDGCVHRTWDGAHAPAPLVSHMLAGVLQSPAFNLDFLVCHVLICLFVWLVLACASIGQPDFRLSWRGSRDEHRQKGFGDATKRQPVLEQTYYSMGGQLPSSSSGRKSFVERFKDSLSTVRSVPTSCDCVRETATREEITPLTQRPNTASRHHSAPSVGKRKTSSRLADNGLHRLSAGGSLIRGQIPTRCLFKMSQHFMDTEEDAGSEDLSEEEIISRNPSAFR